MHNFLLPIRSHFEKDTFLNIFPEDMVAEFLATIGFSPTCSFSFDDRVEFIDQVTEFLLYRCKPQVDAIRTGMCQVIPHGLLSATSWKSLQILVCGTMDIDVDMLKRHTEYSGTSEVSALEFSL